MTTQISLSTPIFVLGLAVGMTLILIGLAIGIWVGRKMSGPQVLDDSLDRLQIMQFVRRFASITSEFAGDFSAYQTEFESLARRAAETGKTPSATEVQALIDRIVSANRDLKNQLSAAESKLAVQTEELAGYLTEARTDGLTGLSNRRAFDEAIEQHHQTWKLTQNPFCLVLCDIDFFKKINDTYGHPAGDAVLVEVGRRFRELELHGVEVARYGGEEFAIVGDMTLELIAPIVESFRAEIESMQFAFAANQIPVTISAGISQIGTIPPTRFSASDERIGAYVRRADEALYAAKMGGRNRIYYHDGRLCRLWGEDRILNRAMSSKDSSIDNANALSNPRELSIKDRLQSRVAMLIDSEAQRSDAT